jgi:hypothetical protein
LGLLGSALNLDRVVYMGIYVDDFAWKKLTSHGIQITKFDFFLHILWLTICFFSSGIFCILIFSVGSRPWLFPRVASLYKSLKGQI